jgi:hypothetical protein
MLSPFGKTTVKTRPSSTTCVTKVVDPLVCPLVSSAVRATSPTFRMSPSPKTESTVTGSKPNSRNAA